MAKVVPSPEYPRSYEAPSPPLDQLLNGSADLAAIAAANQKHGYSMRKIATHLGCSVATVSRRISANEGQVKSRDVV